MAAILLVVGNAAAPTSSDTYLEGILEGLGHTVTLRSDDDADDVTGFNGVVIAESVASATIGAKYGTAAVPVITHETGNINDLRLSDVEGATEVSGTQIDVQPEGEAHPIFDGPHGAFASGTYTIFTSPAGLGYNDDATFPSGVELLAFSTALSSRRTVFACEAGAILTSGTAEGKRAFLFPTNTAAPGITADGENMLKNAYAWAFGPQTVYRRFYGPAQLTGTAATLYTCPNGRRARVLHIHASNPSGAEVDLNLSIGSDAAATRVYDDFPVAADSVESNYDPYDLAEGDVIQGWAGTAATLVLTITGYEVIE